MRNLPTDVQNALKCARNKVNLRLVVMGYRYLPDWLYFVSCQLRKQLVNGRG